MLVGLYFWQRKLLGSAHPLKLKWQLNEIISDKLNVMIKIKINWVNLEL